MLAEHIAELLGDGLLSWSIDLDELTLEINSTQIRSVCRKLRDDDQCAFEQLIDLCGLDYADYGTGGGQVWPDSRYAVVYHLLSLRHNNRIRLRVQLDEVQPAVDSVIDVWPVADWFEREAFDLFGFIFAGHPDLRRLLTDYGFIGHPFRKDFPLAGNVEMIYDKTQGRVVYRPVTIVERVLVPRTIRTDTLTGRRRSRQNQDDLLETD